MTTHTPLAVEVYTGARATLRPSFEMIDGIPLRDRVWLDRELTGPSAAAPPHAPG